MPTDTQHDWDDAFANMAHIPGSERLPEVWAGDAAAYRSRVTGLQTDVPYGPQPRMAYDILSPVDHHAGLAIFVHGGYWMQSGKDDWTHYAQGARAAGWVVCIPGYVLAPKARLTEITRQIGAAITQVARRVTGPIRLIGHSAGGHLVSRMICDDTPLPADILNRVTGVVSLSGVHDLRPLLHTKMNATLQLDGPEAAAESPQLHQPAAGIPLTTWVGGNERPEFLRQAQILADTWAQLDHPAACVIEPGKHHFDVLDGLLHPDSPLTRTWLEADVFGHGLLR